MGLHIEIGADASRREWQALAVLALGMLGESASAIALATGLNNGPAVPLPTAAPVSVVPTPPPAAPTTPAEAAEALMVLASQTRVVPEAVAGEALPEGSAELPVVPVDRSALDTAGRPHDNRIHAATKTLNKDGTWRYLRGVDKDLVAHVEAELDRIMAAPAVTAEEAAGLPVQTDPAVAFGAPGPVVTDPAAAFGGNASPPVPNGAGGTSPTPAPSNSATPAASPATPPAPVAAPEVPAAGEMAEFARIMRTLVAKKLPADVTKAIAVQLGLTGVPDLARRPDLIPAFEAMLP